MKLIFKLALPMLIATSGVVQAQTTVSAAQLPGTWLCKATFTTGNSNVNNIDGHAVYSANGTVTHADEWTQTLLTGESIVMQTKLAGRWRFEPSTNKLLETITSANVTYDAKNQLANTVGAQTQRSYQDVLNKEQSTLTVRLNQKEWIAMLGNPTQNPIIINCMRG